MENSKKFKAKKRLVVSICPKCGETLVIFTDLNVLHCDCGNHLHFDYRDLKDAKYICPNCGKSAYFKVLGDIKDIKCNGCSSWIDFTWHKKYKKYLSLNMI